VTRYYGGIDVATKCGWSLLAAPTRGRVELVDCGVITLGPEYVWCDVARISDHLRGPAAGPLLVGLEEPYLNENPKALKVLARYVGRFEQQLEDALVTTTLVTAQAWQTAVLGHFGGVRRDERKKACRLWAKAMFKRDLPEDAADATGLAYYLATKGRVG
jgi:Holliday junction resolvasome RuvABC endonuclease subunit